MITTSGTRKLAVCTNVYCSVANKTPAEASIVHLQTTAFRLVEAAPGMAVHEIGNIRTLHLRQAKTRQSQTRMEIDLLHR